MDGLVKSSETITDATATYNAAAITYMNHLERPLSQWLHRGSNPTGFGMFDLDPRPSGEAL